MVRYVLFCILALQLPLMAQPSGTPNDCEAPAEIQDALSRAGRGSVEALLTQYPGNFWVQRAYIDLMADQGAIPANGVRLNSGAGIPGGKVAPSVIAQFRKDYESRPEDPYAAYLHAYSLIHTDTGEAVRILTGLTQRTPFFAPTWITLAILHGYPGFYDQTKLRTYTEGFLARCPDTVESRIASLAAQLDRSDTLITYAKSLRKRIAGKAVAKWIPLYTYLWQLESKIALPAEQAERREFIEKDLKFLEGLDAREFPQVDYVLMQGYQQTGNKAALDTLAARKPSNARSVNFSAFLRAQSEWSRANRAPAPTADEKTRAAYFKLQLHFLDPWVNRLPENTYLLRSRYNALASIPDTPDEMLVREGDRILDLLRRSQYGSSDSIFLDVLQAWDQRNLELNRIAPLIHEFMSMQSTPAVPSSYRPQSDLYGGSYRELLEENRRWTTNTRAWTILVSVHAKNHRFDPARGVLSEWEKALNERRRKADEISARRAAERANASGTANPLPKPVDRLESLFVGGIFTEESKYYDGCAKLAAAEGRSLDALTFYQSSLRLKYGRSPASLNVADLDAGKAAEALWKELGGSQDGWRAWLESIRTLPLPKSLMGPRWSVIDRPIPDFALSDQSGKTWTLHGLKGKTTFINVWATWCGPCRSELPHLQKLYEQVRTRDDVQVITLNIDEDPSLVDPFLKSNNLSFPSLFARDFVKEFAGPIGIPTNWIVDNEGTIRREVRGFGGDGSQWLVQTLKRIEQVSAEAGSR